MVDEKNNPDKLKEDFNTEYKKKFRPFSQYDYTGGGFANKQELANVEEYNPKDTADIDKNSSWYRGS